MNVGNSSVCSATVVKVNLTFVPFVCQEGEECQLKQPFPFKQN